MRGVGAYRSRLAPSRSHRYIVVMDQPPTTATPTTDRSHWHCVVVRAGDDRAALEAAYDARQSTSVTERLALAWQLSVEAGRLAGWGNGEQGLSRPHRVPDAP